VSYESSEIRSLLVVESPGRQGLLSQKQQSSDIPRDKNLREFNDSDEQTMLLLHFFIYTVAHSTAFDGDIEAIHTALRLLNLNQNKFERAIIFSDSKAAMLSAGSTETLISTEARDCQVLIRLKAQHKQIALQWIRRRCQIAGNEHADALAKKGARITQIHIRETS
jgi:ribonuclease HI